MATLEQALRELYTEVTSSICSITPNRVIESSAAHFTRHNEDGAQDELRLIDGLPRQFEFGVPMDDGPSTLGFKTEGHRYRIPITFQYPKIQSWEFAAMDDMDAIRHWFGVNHGTSLPAGIASRHIDYQTQPEIEQAEDWTYYTVYMLVETIITFA